MSQPSDIRLLLIDEVGPDSLLGPLLKSTFVHLQGAFLPQAALRHIQRLRPDVLLMHIQDAEQHMALLKEVYHQYGIPVILVTHFSKNDFATEALKLGATDFVRKPGSDHDLFVIKEELVKKILIAGQISQNSRKIKNRRLKKPVTAWEPHTLDALSETEARLLVIGTSTGGPNALHMLLSRLPQLPLPVIIIQHMPEGDMTQFLAERLNKVCVMPFKAAENKELLKAGHVYLVPGDYHLELLKNQRVYLNQKPPVCSVRPSIDVTLKSAIKPLDGKILSVILTGMGQDGLQGVKALKAAGGRCLAEAETSCVVYGMPKAIVEHELADNVVPLEQMAGQIVHQLQSWR